MFKQRFTSVITISNNQGPEHQQKLRRRKVDEEAFPLKIQEKTENSA
ncbi:hypothetical protein BT93_B0701 [Corymbia citriodora subsp. variegata]|nr:hypothetical protein BT93_B0701 [Corymbia citriodora subsp. variegata]